MSNLPVVNPAQLGTALAEATQRSPEQGDMPYLRLIKSGEWVYGADDIEVQDGSKWAVNPNSFIEGFVAWGDGELVDERMAPMAGAPILLSDLPSVPEARDGWKRQVGVSLYCLNGDDKGTQVVFKTSSKGGQKAIKQLVNDVVSQINSDPAHIVANVMLEMDSYKHKTYGKIFTPIFNIVEWGNFQAEAAPVKDAAEEGLAVPEPVQEDAVEQAAEPQRKRRRAIAS